MTCIRVNCNEKETHVVKSENGYFGIGYCDKHWKERDTEVEGRLLME